MPVRIKAFLIHLAISLVVLAGLLYVVVFIWYPPPFFAADGGWQGVRIIVGVDVILGPILTLAVFDPSKGMRRLRGDLLVIAVIQISALAVGAWIVADQRTSMVTFADNRFVSMSKDQLRESGVSKEVLTTLKTQNPPMAYVRMPENILERNQLAMNMSGPPLFKRGDLYEPFTPANRADAMAQGYDLDKVVLVTPGLKPRVDKLLGKLGKTAEQLIALPLYCRYAILTLVMDRETGDILDTVKISHDQLIASRGWKRLQEQSLKNPSGG